jgi:hypothetical protein
LAEREDSHQAERDDQLQILIAMHIVDNCEHLLAHLDAQDAIHLADEAHPNRLQ